MINCARIKQTSYIRIPIMLILWVLVSFACAHTIHAQTSKSEIISSQFGLASGFNETVLSTNQDVKSVIASIINIVLGFLGIVAVIIIATGGFKWVTAGGSDDQIEKARKTIVHGVVGLVVVFLAWSIATFVINRLIQATGTVSPNDAGATSQSLASDASYTARGNLASQTTTFENGFQTEYATPLPNNETIAPYASTQDSDADGLTDIEERTVYNTNPLIPDSDGDGYSDGTEAQNGYNPNGEGKITDAQNGNSCGSLLSLLGEALVNPDSFARVQTQIQNCCAQSNDPLCAGL